MWTAPVLNDGSSGSFGIGRTIAKHGGHSVAGHSGGPELADVISYPDEELAWWC